MIQLQQQQEGGDIQARGWEAAALAGYESAIADMRESGELGGIARDADGNPIQVACGAPCAVLAQKAGELAQRAAPYTGRLANQLGEAGEAFVAEATGLLKNAEESFVIAGRLRFPDFLDAANRLLIESKNVAYQAFTAQIRDYLQISQDLGYKMWLWIRPDTILSGPLQQQILNGDIILQYFKF
jgi:hypothetical protein